MWQHRNHKENNYTDLVYMEITSEVRILLNYKGNNFCDCESCLLTCLETKLK